MQGYFPDSQSTMVWIIGSLQDDGVHLEFDRPDWLTVEWLAEKPYRGLDSIAFGEPDVEGHVSHEDYFDYFDEKGIRVYLQVEPGFSDVKTLMDILMEEYGSHPCIAGFGVDVEWYWGCGRRFRSSGYGCTCRRLGYPPEGMESGLPSVPETLQCGLSSADLPERHPVRG